MKAEGLEANELRVGNLVEWYEPNTGDPLYVKVTGIVGHMIHATVNNTFQVCHENYQSWKPIVLNDNLLLRLGFVKDSVDNTYYKGDFEIMLPTYFMWKSSNIKKTIVKHLHQLQNLYFALTGEELNIQL